jgi:hypothetical protein
MPPVPEVSPLATFSLPLRGIGRFTNISQSESSSPSFFITQKIFIEFWMDVFPRLRFTLFERRG